MGNSATKLPAQDLRDYQDLTYLSKNEIVRAFRRMQREVKLAGRNPQQPSEMFLRFEDLERMPEFMFNPFRDRICSVFSSRKDNTLTFEDFLDVLSVFSESAPKSVKTAYAFKIYDFNEDSLLDQNDLAELIRRLTNPEQLGGLHDEEIQKICKYIMQEADLDENGYISLTEFELVVSKSPDFVKTFCIRF
ncbi:calcium and integrin-binding protein 1-like [Paramacrobiotus metropolitanus]|uniref:calcium and integrin-binding protein 1-like n=1 Tax=Paramacrobiotus metropolitanus TaxID=2943436 RepID=UPI002445DF90|nr:calcium and integrin-binding protein 1-like [Paramacrobiotus metropolitanus]